MSNIITENIILRLHSKCKEILEEEVFSNSNKLETLHLDVASIIDIVGWKILAPLLSTIVGGYTVQVLKEKYLSKSMQEIKENVLKKVGDEISSIASDHLEERIILVHEALKPYGVSREQSRCIFTKLLDEMKKPKAD